MEGLSVVNASIFTYDILNYCMWRKKKVVDCLGVAVLKEITFLFLELQARGCYLQYFLLKNWTIIYKNETPF